ncbi:MAG: thiamine pyrophosphate-dependent dehydrogenase E1 component subunit alpha [Anaerolineae bacterium]
MKPDLWSLYQYMLKSRLFEEAVAQLWNQGHISGEMHLSVGEEAIAAGIVTQLQEGDAMALDHRGTSPLLMRGVDPVLLLREFLGRPDGLCAGKGGHMHLFSPAHLAASSGIVGASGPTAAGFALAAQYLRPQTLAVAFFGDGATNQGMLLEAMNLAAAWNLPLLFVCKDNGWAISTHSPSVSGGNLLDRARGFGLRASEVDGSDVEAVWGVAREALERARQGNGPTFLCARCVHLEGHLLGDPLLGMTRHPLKEMRPRTIPMLRTVSKKKGAPVRERAASLRAIASIAWAIRGQSSKQHDPVERTRQQLKADGARLQKLETETQREVERLVQVALLPAGQGGDLS